MASVGDSDVVSMAREYGLDEDGALTLEEAMLRVESAKKVALRN
jgi:hypothetical protein